MTDRRIFVALAAAALCLTAVAAWWIEPVGVPAPPRSQRARASLPFQFTGKARPVLASVTGWEGERRWSDGVDWEPVVGAAPDGERVYQLATRFNAGVCADCPDPILVFRISEDGGQSWGPDRYPFRQGRTQADPQLAVAANGTVFAAFLQDYRPGVMLARSDDGGRSWLDPVAVTGELRPRWSDHPYLFTSADGADVYVALNASDSWIVASHDGGATFAPPVRTNGDGRYWFHSGGAVLADGTALVAAVDYSQSYRGRAHVNVLLSRDGGASWQSQRVDRSEEAPSCDEIPGCYLGFLGSRASLAADPEGTVMLVYNAAEVAGGPQALWYRTSTDGVSWSRRRRVVRSGPEVTHAFPEVLAGTLAGEFHVFWQDDRRGAWNTWYRGTVGAGDRWSGRVRLSSSGPPAAYKQRRGYAFPYGDYFGIARDGSGRLHAIWGAGESWNGLGGAWYTRTR